MKEGGREGGREGRRVRDGGQLRWEEGREGGREGWRDGGREGGLTWALVDASFPHPGVGKAGGVHASHAVHLPVAEGEREGGREGGEGGRGGRDVKGSIDESVTKHCVPFLQYYNKRLYAYLLPLSLLLSFFSFFFPARIHSQALTPSRPCRGLCLPPPPAATHLGIARACRRPALRGW